MVRKFRYLSIPLVTLSIFITSSFVSSSVLSDYNTIYDVMSDVSYIDIVPPAGAVRYRWNNGVLQANYGTSGRWDDVTSPVELLYMLNQLGVASIDDIPTSQQYYDSLSQYFGTHSLPYSGSVFEPGGNGLSIHSYSDIFDFLSWNNHLLSYLFTTLPQWAYLNPMGGLTINPSNISFSGLTTNGFLGLGTLLGGASAPAYSHLTEDGMISGISQPYLKSLNEAIIGLYNGVYSKSGSYIYDPGQTAPFSVSFSDISSILRSYFQRLQLASVSQIGYLDIDGLLNSTHDGQYVTLSDITASGFRGLGTILRGTDGIPLNRRYNSIDYKTNTVHTDNLDNIFDLLLYPLTDIQNDLALYLYSHGTDLDIKERENMQPQAEEFVDDFTSSSGAGTPSVGNIKDTAGVSGSMKSLFESSTTPSDAFNQLGDDGNYGFLSSQTQQRLNPFYNPNARSFDGTVDYVTPKLQSIFGGVGSHW